MNNKINYESVATELVKGNLKTVKFAYKHIDHEFLADYMNLHRYIEGGTESYAEVLSYAATRFVFIDPDHLRMLEKIYEKPSNKNFLRRLINKFIYKKEIAILTDNKNKATTTCIAMGITTPKNIAIQNTENSIEYFLNK